MQFFRFSALVDRHLDAIAQALRGAAPADGSVPQASRAAPPAVPLPRALVTVLTPRTLMVGDEASPASRHHVFGTARTGLPFVFRATLVPEGNGAAFVEAAYAAILGRRSDESGRATYVTLLQGGVLTPGDLIRSLASSDEARGRPGAVLIVPDTSAWLSGLARAPSAIAIAPEALP